MTRMTKSRIRVTEYYRDSAGKILRLGLIATVSAQCQALALVLVVLLTRAFTGKRTYYHGSVAGVKINLTTMQLTGLAILMLIVASILDTIVGWIKSKMITTWDFVHREEVVNEYLQADFATQSAERLGTLGLITGYVQRGSSMLGAITGGLVSALTLLTYICYALLLDYRAAIVMVGSVVVIAICLAPVMKRIKAYGRALSAEQIHYTRDVTEATRMVRDLRVFDALDPLSKRLLARSARLNRLRQRANFVNGMVGSVYQYIGMMIVLVGLAVAQALGTVDIVKLGAIALLLIRSLSYGQGLQGTYQNVVDGVPYLEKLEDLRDLYRSHRTVDGHLVIESVQTLELDQLRYSYDGVTDAIAGVSAKLHVGEIVGIVGPSGGGKSTLSQLLLRLREPTGGAILVDGVNAAEFKRSSWYRNVSVVPQDPRLFHASVAENIALMDKRITRDDVIAAAKAAGIHEVIERLEDGYETRIGPAFRDLSGGQIQRIGIARALSRGARVLVLDEPTSALDVHSEAVIQATLESLRGQALVLIIAHRLSTLSICDRIVVLRDGMIESMGTLSETSEQSEFFRRALEAGTLEIAMGDTPPRTPAPDEV